MLKRIKSHNNERPDDFLDMINNKNKILKRWQQQRRGEDRIKILDKTINKAIQEHRNQLWGKIVNGISPKDNLMWQIAKRYNNRFAITLEEDNNRRYETDVQ